MNEKRIITLMFSVIVCIGLCGVSVLGAGFEHTGYSGKLGETVDMKVDFGYIAYNSSYTEMTNVEYNAPADTLITTSDANTNAIMDGDITTGWQVTNSYTLITHTIFSSVHLHFPAGLGEFNSLYCKKSNELGLLGMFAYSFTGLTITNNTFGSPSSYQLVTNSLLDAYGCGYIPYGANETKLNIIGVSPINVPPTISNTVPISNWQGKYGKIDNVSFGLMKGPTGALKDSFIYELHFYNTYPSFDTVYVYAENGDLMAWKVVTTDLSAGSYNLAVTIPTNAIAGNYFIMVYDTYENNYMTTLNVNLNSYSIWVWIYPIVGIFITMGLFAATDFVADTKTNQLSTVFLGGMTIMAGFITAVMIADIMGWWSSGILVH